MSHFGLQLCGENASFGGNCLTSLDVHELWLLDDEVYTHT